MKEYILVLTTVPDKKTGETIAKKCVKDRMAACVTISGLCESHYRWKGDLVKEKEHILFIKTKASLFPGLKEKILKLHPYEVPEIIALPLSDGHPGYLDWIDEETEEKET
ncbi:MAG: divalent-cation tolerance protein CutA [Candidatus Aminicenantales bacterium]